MSDDLVCAASRPGKDTFVLSHRNRRGSFAAGPLSAVARLNQEGLASLAPENWDSVPGMCFSDSCTDAVHVMAVHGQLCCKGKQRPQTNTSSGSVLSPCPWIAFSCDQAQSSRAC